MGCHLSVSNCAVCTGFFNSSATAPNCGGSPSPQPQPMPSPGPCSDDNQNCGNWAASGQCEANHDYMLANCRLSCGVCSPPTQAPAPPTRHLRHRLRAPMRIRIAEIGPPVDNVRQTPPTCCDENQNCGNWAASGQCQANPAYML